MLPSSATAMKYLSILMSMAHNIPYSGISVNYGFAAEICCTNFASCGALVQNRQMLYNTQCFPWDYCVQKWERLMEEAKKRLKVYCETTFWSYLNGGRTPLSHIAVKQAFTRQWWQDIAPSCEIYVSQHVGNEAADGDPERAKMRQSSIATALFVDGLTDEVTALADVLLGSHAVPDKEITDALHIATASVYAMDVLLTWNCRHMANPVTLPKTSGIIVKAGYDCPIIITPQEFLERREEFGYGN